MCVVLSGSQNNGWFKLLFFKCVATQLISWEWKREEKKKKKETEHVPVWTLGHSVSPWGTHLALHVSSGWRLRALLDSLKSYSGIVFLWVFKNTVVVVLKQRGPAHRSFNVKHWADLFRAVQMDHCLTAQVGEELTDLNLSHPRWVITFGGLSLYMGCDEREEVRPLLQIICWKKCTLFLDWAYVFDHQARPLT